METTMTYHNVEYHPRRPILVPMILLVVLAFVVSIYSVHATAKHGADAEAVRRCLENGDPLQVWVKMSDGRVFQVCRLQDGRYGVQICTGDCEGSREITSFIYRASKGLKVKLSQVEYYLRNNVGALRIK
jgi:hypothetical protein